MTTQLDIVDMLLTLSSEILTKQPIKPNLIALQLEQITALAWDEAERDGYPTWQDAEDLAPSLRID